MDKRITKSKNPNVDILTTLFLLIVLYIHHNTYGLPISNWINRNFASLLVIVAVGGFIFLSGYKLTKSKKYLTLIPFIQDRFFRIYPLYWLSLIFFFFFLNSGFGLNHLLIHVFGLQIIFDKIFGPPYITLYFVGLLSAYYIIFYLTKPYLSNIKKYLIINCIIFGVSYFLHVIAPFGIKVFEYRFFLYYPFFSAGMISGGYSKTVKTIKPFQSLICIIPFICVGIVALFSAKSGISKLYSSFDASYFIIVPSYILCLIYCMSFPQKRIGLQLLFSFITCCSYCVYLFHRPIWFLFNLIWKKMALINLLHQKNINAGPLMQWIFVNGLGTTTLFLISYFVQRYYNRIISVWLNKNK